MSRPRSALRRLSDLLAPDGPPAGAADMAPADDLVALAEHHDLLPALRSALVVAGAPPADVRLRTAPVRNLARNLALVDQVTVLLAALDRAGIPAAPLKGIDTVLEEVYADWGARTMADLDVLVEPSAGETATEVLVMVRRVPDVDWELVRDRSGRDGCLARVDAHLAATAELFAVAPPVAPGRSGRWVARRELFVDDHPVVGLLERPGRRFARLRRERLERYYGNPLPGAATWRARARFLGEVAAHRRAAMAGGRRPRRRVGCEDTGEGVRPPG